MRWAVGAPRAIPRVVTLERREEMSCLFWGLEVPVVWLACPLCRVDLRLARAWSWSAAWMGTALRTHLLLYFSVLL